MLCVFMVEGMSVGVNVMLFLMSVISPPPDLCGLSARTVVYVGTLGVLDLEVSLVSLIVMMSACVFLMRVLSSSSLLFMPFILTCRMMRFLSLLLLVTCGICSVCSPNCPSRVKIWNNPVHVVRLCG